jgi:CTP:molybdopterin cytidylyltransferase MocA
LRLGSRGKTIRSCSSAIAVIRHVAGAGHKASSDMGTLQKGHPIIINVPKYRQAIANLPEEAGLHALMHEHADDVRLLDVATEDIIRDIDGPDDYTRELARFTERRSSL